MKAKTVQIHWHQKHPVFSLDTHPLDPQLLVTAGGDNAVRASHAATRFFWNLKSVDLASPWTHVPGHPQSAHDQRQCGSMASAERGLFGFRGRRWHGVGVEARDGRRSGAGGWFDGVLDGHGRCGGGRTVGTVVGSGGAFVSACFFSWIAGFGV